MRLLDDGTTTSYWKVEVGSLKEVERRQFLDERSKVCESEDQKDGVKPPFKRGHRRTLSRVPSVTQTKESTDLYGSKTEV